MTNQSLKDVQGFFHVNVNCTNFVRSLSFYQLVGFEKFLDFDDTGRWFWARYRWVTGGTILTGG